MQRQKKKSLSLILTLTLIVSLFTVLPVATGAAGRQITLCPDTIVSYEGGTVTIDGEGFNSEDIITIEIDDEVVGTTPTTVETDTNGDFSCTVVIPAGPSKDYTVKASDIVGFSVATLTAAGRRITLSPDTVVSYEGGTVTITGEGFRSETPITIKIDETVVTTTPATVETNASGEFSCTISIPAGPSKDYTVKASDSEDFSSTTLTAAGRRITLSPSAIIPDKEETITITGAGFNSEKTIGIEIDGAAVATIPAVVESDTNGDFSCTVIIPAGPRQTYVITAWDNTAFCTAEIKPAGAGAIEDDDVTPQNPGGSFSVGSSYITGSNLSLIFIAQKDFLLFSFVRIDDVTLTRETHYTAENSSTKITLLPDYLNTLKAGEHTLTVGFKDGASTTAAFTVVATEGPVPITPVMPVNPFTDVQGTDWFIDDVIYVYNKGLINGTSTSPMLFSPGASLTRGMIVTILHRLEGEPEVSGVNSPFSDVAAEKYYYAAIRWAANNGLVAGYGEGKFGPDDNITRQDLAVILMRYMIFKKINIPVTMQWIIFADEADVAGYAMDSIQTLNKLGIINGTGSNANGQIIISPKSNATRAEVAAILHRFLLKIEQ